MNASMAIDFGLIVVFVACVWLAARRGIFNAVSGIVGSVAGLVGALLLTPRLEGLTAGLLRPFVGGMVKRAAQSAGLEGILSSSVAEDTLEGFSQLLDALGVPSGAQSAAVSGAQSAGQSLSDAAAQALSAQLAPVVTFVALFLILQLAVRIVCSLLSLNIPLLRSVNRLGGALLGAAAGAVMVSVLCWGIMRYAPMERTGLLNRPALLESRVGGAVCSFFHFDGQEPSE